MTGVLEAAAVDRAAFPNWWQRLLRARVLAVLERLRAGAVALHDGDGTRLLGTPDGPLGTVAVHVHAPAFWRAVATGGALGAGEAFVAGHWTADDPVRLVRLLLRDADVLAAVDRGPARLLQPLRRAWRLLRANTRAGARRNIHAHYDLGDAFFATFLDPSMTYSSAFFASPDQDLGEAQQAKLQRLLHKLDLHAGERLLEIGSGWGSMALAAGAAGARVLTTTISPAQFARANARVAAAGLADRVEVRCQDWRDLDGAWDKAVSVEMVEAIGPRLLPAWFAQVARRLRPGGAFAVQAITIRDQDYAASRRRVDFIQRHVFPGSFIPSTTVLLQAATQASDLRLWHLEDLAPHYAATLRAWRRRFHAALPALRAAGHPEAFLRTWDWYLAYCEGGFAERRLGLVQAVFVRPGHRLPAVAGPVGGSPPDPYGA